MSYICEQRKRYKLQSIFFERNRDETKRVTFRQFKLFTCGNQYASESPNDANDQDHPLGSIIVILYLTYVDNSASLY